MSRRHLDCGEARGTDGLRPLTGCIRNAQTASCLLHHVPMARIKRMVSSKSMARAHIFAARELEKRTHVHAVPSHSARWSPDGHLMVSRWTYTQDCGLQPLAGTGQVLPWRPLPGRYGTGLQPDTESQQVTRSLFCASVRALLALGISKTGRRGAPCTVGSHQRAEEPMRLTVDPGREEQGGRRSRG